MLQEIFKISCQQKTYNLTQYFLLWPAYMLSIQYFEDFANQRLASDLSVVSKANLWVRMQRILNEPQTAKQNLFYSIPLRITALMAARGG